MTETQLYQFGAIALLLANLYAASVVLRMRGLVERAVSRARTSEAEVMRLRALVVSLRTQRHREVS